MGLVFSASGHFVGEVTEVGAGAGAALENVVYTDAAMVAKVPCNLTPRHPPSQVLDNLPRYAG